MFFFLPKIYQLLKYYTMFVRKIFFLPSWGVVPSLPPVSYAYAAHSAFGTLLPENVLYEN